MEHEKQKGRVIDAAFLLLHLLLLRADTAVFWLPDLDSNQGPAD
jgi:hypothetical protein